MIPLITCRRVKVINTKIGMVAVRGGQEEEVGS
jgi:hypothetical protein